MNLSQFTLKRLLIICFSLQCYFMQGHRGEKQIFLHLYNKTFKNK